MSAIPAQEIVNSLPGVLNASGSAVSLTGLLLTNSPRVPIGTVQSFPNQPAVAAFFGATSDEAAEATTYFDGFDGATATPGALLVAQYPTNVLGVTPYLRGGSLAAMSLAQLQAIAPGTMGLTVNGVALTSSTINLSGVASFSAAAAAIQTAFNAADAVVTGAIAPSTFSVTGSISQDVLSVANVGAGQVVPGAILSGTGVTTGTKVLQQLTGTAGGVGTYLVDTSQTAASTTISGAYGTLTVSAVTSGALAVGQLLSGTGVSPGTEIFSAGTGTGGTGTYFVTPSETVASTTLTAGALAVTFDSVSGAITINGGTPATGTIGYASGSVATALNLTAATGAVLSQGAPVGVPAVNMAAILSQSTAWGSFTTTWEPDVTNKLAFAAWTNAQNKRYAYSCWSTDPAVAAGNAPQSAGQQITAAGYDGTILTWSPTPTQKGSMVMGFAASLDFTRPDGRATFAFRSQSGMAADVTDATTAANLKTNGYNYYGAYSDAESFTFYYPGKISGKFAWCDTYFNQIWLNSSLRTTMLRYMMQVGEIAYTLAGYTGIETAMLAPIQAALNFGAIRAGVTLSPAQIAAAATQAGLDISSTLQTRGWYLQILDPGATVRAARGSPIINFWYTDGGSVQQLTIPSEVVQ